MWRRTAASILLMILPASGIWLARACADTTNTASDYDEDALVGPNCCVNGMCPAHAGERPYCPSHSNGETESYSCSISSASLATIVMTALAPAVVPEMIMLHRALETRAIHISSAWTPLSILPDLSTPPPKG